MRKINKLQYTKTEIMTSHKVHKLHSGKYAALKNHITDIGNKTLITTLDIKYRSFPTFVIIVLCITRYFLNFSCTTITKFFTKNSFKLFFVKTS